ncbi:MAG: J domain-containing protein [Psychrobacter sp.]|nr:J domain-containing protein [Psychrobacter sp.]
MQTECWQVLAIAPTDNENDIKRAYAIQLKHNKPDKNPAGFVKLREAYEQALAQRQSCLIAPKDDVYPDFDSNTDLNYALNDTIDLGKVSKSQLAFEVNNNNKNKDKDKDKQYLKATLTTLDNWQDSWQHCSALPDADRQLFATLEQQFAQRPSLALDDLLAFEDSLLAWHFDHATDYPLSFEYCVQTLNWRQQASQIQIGAKFSDDWYDLYWLLEDYNRHNREVFLQRRSQHTQISSILYGWEQNWRISLINNGLLKRLEEDFDFSQDFNEQAKTYFSQSFLIWLYDQPRLHVDAFEFAYRVFYWRYRLREPDRYRFPWSYLPRLLERYEPQVAQKNTLKITDVTSFERYIKQRYPQLFARWVLDPFGSKPTIVITSEANDASTSRPTLQPASPNERQLWTWRWQFIWEFKFAYHLNAAVKQLQEIEAIIEQFESQQSDDGENTVDKARVKEAGNPLLDAKRNEISQYWEGSAKLRQLYRWSFTGFVRPTLGLMLGIVSASLILVMAISSLFKETLWQWQHISIDTLAVSLILGFALFFWQWQLTLFANVQRFFERKQGLARYGIWIGGVWLILMLLPDRLLLGAHTQALASIIDGQQAIPSFGQLTLFATRHILGMLMVNLLTVRSFDVHTTTALWYASILGTLMVTLNLLAWVTMTEDVLLFALSPWVWAVFALPVYLKIRAKRSSGKPTLHTWAEVLMFLVMAAVLYVMLFGFYFIGVLLPPQQLVVSAGVLIALLTFWALSLLRTWVYCSKTADYLACDVTDDTKASV